MKTTLSEDQIARIQMLFSLGILVTDDEVKNLVNDGFEEDIAKQLIAAVVKQHRASLFKNKLKKEDKDQAGEIATTAIIFLALAGPIFGATSPLWYLFASIAAGIAGYYGFKDKPAAGIIAAVLMVILLPITFGYYMNGRESYIKIELLIPMFMAFVPSFLTFLLISKLFYSNK